MGEQLLTDIDLVSDRVEGKSYGQVFDEQCPYYLSIGMTWEQYWNGDPVLPRFFREKHEIEQRRTNLNAWVQGQYFLAAIGAALSKNGEYPREPFPATEEEAAERRERERRRRIEKWVQQVKAESKAGETDE